MSEPIKLYDAATGAKVVMHAPRAAAAMVEAGTHSYSPVEIAAAPEPPAGKPITDMNKAELQETAGRMGIEFTSDTTKAQLLDLIAAADPAA